MTQVKKQVVVQYVDNNKFQHIYYKQNIQDIHIEVVQNGTWFLVYIHLQMSYAIHQLTATLKCLEC